MPDLAVELKSIQETLEKNRGELHTFLAKHNEQLAVDGKTLEETKTAVLRIDEEIRKSNAKIAELEQKQAGIPGGRQGDEGKDIAMCFTESDQYKALSGSSGASRARLEIKTAITNPFPFTNDQPLVAADRLAGIISNPDRRLRIRDLVPVYQTSSNLVEYAKENVFTNNAGPQIGSGSPTQIENVAKAESGLTFTLANTAVITLAHNIPASRQVLDDAPMLEGYIRNRLIYGLNLEEEEEILVGTGASGTLNGLINQATAFASSASGPDTKIDVIRRMITGLELNNFTAEAVVLNPADWQDIELTKDTEGRYIFANPQQVAAPRIWGLPVVSSNTMTAGSVLAGAFSQACGLFDRMTLVVELFREHSDFAAKNMVLLQAEKRIAFAVWRALGLLKATF